MESGKNKQSWGLALITLMIGLILGAFAYSRLAGKAIPFRTAPVPAEEPSGSGAPPDVVRISPESQNDVGIVVEPVSFRKLQETLSATGIVSEDPIRVAHIRPLARGVIEKTYVRLGDRVAEGSPLVEYDNIELGIAIGEYLTAKAELQRSLTDFEVKQTILARGKEMLKVGAIARTSYDLREAEYKDAEAKTAGARAAVEKIEEQIHRFGWTDGDLENLPKRRNASGHTMTHSILRAPFAGIITAHHASIGEAVEPSTELLAITDMSSLWVLADVFEKDLSSVQTGRPVRVLVASYPGRVFQGRITNVADTIDPKTRTAKVRCVVENAGGLLKLEMFATVEIPLRETGSVLCVPDSAVQQIDGNPVVFVRKSSGEFLKRQIVTGVTGGGYTAVRSGLQAGELAATRGSFVVKTAFLKNLISSENEHE